MQDLSHLSQPRSLAAQRDRARIGQRDAALATNETLWAIYGAAGLAGTALGAYHGYRRNNSLGWALAWGVLGGMFPFVTVPVALAQGLGQPYRGR